ncbi:hypothetical protein GF412_00185 [Candidatus Micrarchaeota archaeon]|nr:hypothetical protein [Candidatus Micrarchaeota archaeon]MBD3417393.1 hypothetical protein [Candidatus Micrarchaeota archaeon]
MKTIEALISLMLLLSFTSASLLSAPAYPSQLQKQQLAEDIWRIAYLKGCFNQSVPSINAENEMESCLNPLVAEIETQTGLGIAFSPQEAAGQELPDENAVVLRKTIVINGIPKESILHVG